MSKMRQVAIAALLTMPEAVLADERAERRSSCVPLVTAIYEGCEITNHFRCDDGSIYAEEHRASGGIQISLFNSDYTMGYAYNPDTGAGAYHVIETFDPFEIDVFLDEGFEAESLRRYSLNRFGFEESYDVQSTYTATNRTRRFSVGDMWILTYTQTQVIGFAGNIGVVEGQLYLDQSLGRYFNGSATMTLGGGQMDLPALIDIVGPDSPFFMTENPEDTCKDLQS